VGQVLARYPKDPSALTLKARLLLADGKTEEARLTIDEALAASPNSALAHLSKARILVAMNRLQDATKEFKETITLDPNSMAAQLELAEFHRKRGEIDTALGYVEEAVRKHPNNLQAHLARARTLLVRDVDYSRAEEEIKTLLEKYPNVPASHIAAGQFFMTGKNVVSARKAFGHALDLAPDAIEALTGLVSLDLSSGDRRGARTRIDAALAKSPDNPGVLLLSGKLHGLAGESAGAEAAFKKVITLDPSHPAAYGLLAKLYQVQGRVEEAKTQFESLANADPRSLAAPTMLGVLYYSTGDRAKARTWWERALEIDPRTASAANNLAWLYAEGNENLDTALQLALIARAAMPEQPEVNDTLGWVYYRKQLNDQAVEYLRRSIEREPQNPVYQYHLGKAYAQMGEDGKARTALNEALALNASFAQAADARQTLETLVY
jgi:tetratricopeptide (TPR) repeat protein